MAEATAFESYDPSFRRATADLQAARRVALDALARDPAADTWEWHDRRWYWPGGEEMRYFASLSPLERRVLADFEAESGFRLLAAGTARVTLQFPPEDDLGEYVVKLPRWGVQRVSADVSLPGFDGGDGRRQNRQEATRWERYGDDPLLPVVAAADDGEWLVMPRASPLPDVDAAAGSVIEGLRAALREDHADLLDGDEVVPENVGRWHDDWFLVDYGRVPRPACE